MLASRPRLLLLLVSLSALALTVGTRTADAERPQSNVPPASAFTLQTQSGLDPALVRLRLDDGRDSGRTQRIPKGGLVLTVLLLGLAVLRDSRRHRLGAVASTMVSRLAGWSPSSGRAPPFHQLPVS